MTAANLVRMTFLLDQVPYNLVLVAGLPQVAAMKLLSPS